MAREKDHGDGPAFGLAMEAFLAIRDIIVADGQVCEGCFNMRAGIQLIGDALTGQEGETKRTIVAKLETILEVITTDHDELMAQADQLEEDKEKVAKHDAAEFMKRFTQ